MSRPPETDLPRLLGPYSPCAAGSGLLFLSGQVAKRPGSVAVVGSVAEQTTQCLDNLFAVLAHEGLGPRHLLKCNVYLVDMHDFSEMNTAYETALHPWRPARTTVQVAALPQRAAVEIEAIASLDVD